MDKWILKEKILQLIRNWPLVLIVILVSSLAGWGLMHLFPPQPRATVDLYVGIDINRVLDVSTLANYAKTEPFNINDYKNWQLSQVAAIASSELIANRTLEVLRGQDPAWKGITPADFQQAAKLSWYDVGRWRLEFRAQDPRLASQAVIAWRDVLVDEFTTLQKAAVRTLSLDGSLRALDAELTGLDSRSIQLNQLLTEVESLELNLKDEFPEDDKLPGEQRDELWTAAAVAASPGQAWTALLDAFPGEEAAADAYYPWLEKVHLTAEAELKANSGLIKALEADYQEVLEDYQQQVEQAKGLSPALIVNEGDTRVQVRTIYPGGMVLVLSGLAGLLLFLMALVMITEIREK
ncbi:MAG: hypothetical protein U5K99_09605 [Anaerolineales bacterium]|nr:hypothetical protein [Anaerolineales bacterium]